MKPSDNQKIKVVIADDHTILATGIAEMLSKRGKIEVSKVVKSGDELLQFLRSNPANLIIMDINMPGDDGIETTRKVKEKFPGIKILILSMHEREGYIQNAVEAGADGYLLKSTDMSEMEIAIDRLISGRNYFSQDVTEKLASRLKVEDEKSSLIKLNSREVHLLRMLSEGLTTDEISVRLSISPHTVTAYRKGLLVKFNARNVSHLVRLAMEKGYISS